MWYYVKLQLHVILCEPLAIDVDAVDIFYAGFIFFSFCSVLFCGLLCYYFFYRPNGSFNFVLQMLFKRYLFVPFVFLVKLCTLNFPKGLN